MKKAFETLFVSVVAILAVLGALSMVVGTIMCILNTLNGETVTGFQWFSVIALSCVVAVVSAVAYYIGTDD